MIVPVGPGVAVGPGHISLGPIPHEPATKILAENGWVDGTAKPLVAKAGAKLSALQRLCGYVNPPPWASAARLPESTALLLIGTWVQGRANDARIAGRLVDDPKRIEDVCFALAEAPGRPVSAAQDRFGPRCWMWSSPGEAWSFLAPSITRYQLEAFAKAAVEVLSVDDPQYELPREQRIYASIKGKVLPHSKELREGIATSIAWLSVSNDQLQPAHGPDAGSNIARNLVRTLLDGNWLRWASLSGVLPILAEAAPDAFLEALEKSLAGADGVLRLFEEESSGVFGGSSPHTGLLWALETLAWSDVHASRVCRALAQLAAGDPPGEHKLANRPARSLAELLHPGIPQSATSASDRVSIARAIARNESAVAWKLVLNAMDSMRGGFVSATAAPRIRPWKTQDTLKGVSVADYELQVRGWLEIAINMSDGYPDRIANLIRVSRFLPSELENQVLAKVEDLVPKKDALDPEGTIWAELRSEIHLIYLAGEKLPLRDPERLARLQTLYEAMAPVDPVRRVAWLFQPFPKVPDTYLHDYEKQKERDAALRVQAIGDLRSGSEPIASLARLAALAPHPILLGDALGESEWATYLVERALAGDLALPTPAVAALLMTHAKRQPPGWLESTLRDLMGRDERELLSSILMIMPSERTTWDIVDSLGGDIRRTYWSSLRWVGSKAQDDAERAVGVLLEVERSVMAMEVAARAETLDPETALRVLEAIRDVPDRATVYEEMANPMFRYHLAKVFQRADASPDEDRLAGLEIIFFRLLEDSERPPRIVFKALAAQPEVFLQLLEWIYRPQDAVDGEEAAEDATPEVVRRAEACDGILHAWDGVPGDGASTPAEREKALAKWAQTALDLAATAKRSKAGLIKVAEVLARAPAAVDGVWPAMAARDLLEGGRFPDLARHMTTARTNSRGMTSRGHLDGGDQERELAKTYREWAQKVRIEFPRTAAMLDGIAARHEHEGRQHDESVRPDRTRFGE